jgi:hypothetical protein
LEITVRNRVSRENILVGTLSPSYSKGNLGKPHFIENYLIEKRLPLKIRAIK